MTKAKQKRTREIRHSCAEELEWQTKKRALALRASHARFWAIFEDAAIGIVLVNQSAHVIAGNPALQRILGYSEEELKRMLLAALTHPDNVEIHFADSGVGIAFADIGDLFKPFHTTKDAGMGLGLYISQRIVREHGGRIDVESVAGEGATFTVWLPA